MTKKSSSIRKMNSRTISMTIVLSILGLVLAPFVWFSFLGTKAFPGQHFVNSLAGVLIGPLYGVLVPLIVGTLRIMLGLGTIFAYPGGIPGVITVGLAYKLTKKSNNPLIKYSCAFAEPVGTVLIGGTLSLLIIAPLMNIEPQLAILRQHGLLAGLVIFWAGWAVSSVPGSVIAYLTLIMLSKALPQYFK
ncbi:MAG: energy coupling factor transporter S component ThiW [Nitrososphaerota archaeon]